MEILCFSNNVSVSTVLTCSLYLTTKFLSVHPLVCRWCHCLHQRCVRPGNHPRRCGQTLPVGAYWPKRHPRLVPWLPSALRPRGCCQHQQQHHHHHHLPTGHHGAAAHHGERQDGLRQLPGLSIPHNALCRWPQSGSGERPAIAAYPSPGRHPPGRLASSHHRHHTSWQRLHGVVRCDPRRTSHPDHGEGRWWFWLHYCGQRYRPAGQTSAGASWLPGPVRGRPDCGN